MSTEFKKKLVEEFSQFITAERKEKLDRYVQQRTRYVTVVLEDIYQAHNISAVLRTADCFGVQDIYVIEDKHRYAINEEVAKGAAQWLSLHRYSQSGTASTAACFKDLRERGYTIVATTPHKKDMFIDQLPLDSKIALVFGTEQQGLSGYALEHADAYVKIPMHGFTESFNISVCAGIALYDVTQRLRKSDVSWHLSEEEMLDVQLEWLGRTTHRGEQIMERLK